MAILQEPLTYYFDYYNSDLGFWLLPFYLLTALVLTILLIVRLLKYKATTTKMHVLGLLSVLLLVTIPFRFNALQYADFYFKKDQRKQVVKLLTANKLKVTGTENTDTIYQLPPSLASASCDKNVWRLTNKGKYLTVEFYTYIGFLGHRSGFLYTNDPETIRYYDSEKNRYTTKYADNWYWVTY